MFRNKIAILGASGFVGSSLLELLRDRDDVSITAFAHSTGGASCLAHKGLILERLDILDRKATIEALTGFDYIINCSRGGPDVMLPGLNNVLEAAKTANVDKLVHLSSVSVYGDPPAPESVNEDAPARPTEDYGELKLAQDEQVQRAAARGLPAVILCPPNIIGPYSSYLLDILESMEAGRFALLDAGETPVNVVDVRNLAEALIAAAHSPVIDGRRLFVCEQEPVTWRELVAELKPLLRNDIQPENLAADSFRLQRPAQTPAQPVRTGAFKHLISDEVRSALRLNPTWAAFEGAAKKTVRRIGGKLEKNAWVAAGGQPKVERARAQDRLNTKLVSQQLRNVRHEPFRAFEAFGYTPPLSFADSMRAFRAWHGEYFDSASPEYSLLTMARMA